MAYEWIIGQGPSEESLTRMEKSFPKPLHPMGEAWFMGETRKYYHELLEKRIDEFSKYDISNYLFEIASGTGSFGRVAEWDNWLLYLLPHLIKRCSTSVDNSEMFQEIITTFVCLYAHGLEPYYKGFREDLIATLPHYLMSNNRWEEWVDRATGQQCKRPTFLESSFYVNWGQGKANEDLSAAMFFCMKYLLPDEIASWVRSLLSIPDAYWRAAIIVWLSGFYDLFKEEEVTWKMIEEAEPKIVWSDSFLIKSRWTEAKEKQLRKRGYYSEDNLLPFENRTRFLNELKKTLTAEVYLEWVESLSSESRIEQLLKYHWELFFDKLTSN